MAAYPPWFDPAMPEREDCVLGALVRQASVGVVEGFSTDRFWDQVRGMNCATQCGLVGRA